MRTIVKKKNSTKPERIVAETLKEMHVPFRHRVKIEGREIDFVIGKYCLEIDGHDQAPDKNEQMVELGYVPIHLNNAEITKERIVSLIKTIMV